MGTLKVTNNYFNCFNHIINISSTTIYWNFTDSLKEGPNKNVKPVAGKMPTAKPHKILPVIPHSNLTQELR